MPFQLELAPYGYRDAAFAVGSFAEARLGESQGLAPPTGLMAFSLPMAKRPIGLAMRSAGLLWLVDRTVIDAGGLAVLPRSRCRVPSPTSAARNEGQTRLGLECAGVRQDTAQPSGN